MSDPHAAHFNYEPLVEQIRRERRRRYERDANRGYASLVIASTLTVAQALYRGRQVPREALKAEYRDRLVCWDGLLTDEIVTDVLVLLEADRAAGDIDTPTSSAWTPRVAKGNHHERRAA